MLKDVTELFLDWIKFYFYSFFKLLKLLKNLRRYITQYLNTLHPDISRFDILPFDILSFWIQDTVVLIHLSMCDTIYHIPVHYIYWYK